MSTTMPALIVNGDVVGYYPPNASSIEFNNTSTTLTSTNIQDAIIELNNNKLDKDLGWTKNTDLNTLMSDGIYHLSMYNTNAPSIGDEAYWSSLYVNGNGVDTGAQLFVSRTNRMFYRNFFNLTWGAWQELALKSDIPNITVFEINTTGKSLNTVYYESLPTGYTYTNCIMVTACFIKYDHQYTMFNLLNDPDLNMAIEINNSSQLSYELKGSQTVNGILKVTLIKY